MSHYSSILLPLSALSLVLIGACIASIVGAIRELLHREEPGIVVFFVTLSSVLAAVIIFVAVPESTLDLLIEDAVEYVLSAERLATDGQYLVSVNGKEYPPRFPPTFSALLLAPLGVVFSMLTGSFIVGAVYGCALLSILGAVAFSLSAYLVANVWAALFALGIFILLPEIRYFGQMAMSDVPFSATLILIFLQMLLLHIRADRKGGWSILGILVACATTIRPFGAIALIPAVLLCWRYYCGNASKSAALKNIFVITVPVAALGIAVLLYNFHVFGHALRSGYHYWMAVPYDYPSLLVSTTHLSENLTVLVEQTAVIPVSLLGIAGWFYYRREKNNRQFALQAELCKIWVMAFLSVALPLMAFHLLYFYPSGRFYLPVTLLAVLPVVAVVGGCLSSKEKTGQVAFCALLVILIAGCFRLTSAPQDPGQHAVVEQWKQVLPANALLFSDRNSAYLERFLVGKSLRRVVPWSREGTYSSKVVTATRVPVLSPFPTDWSDHRAEGLRAAGAVDVYPVVGSELSSEDIQDALSKRPVFIESELLSDALKSQIANYGTLADRGDGLYQLQAYAQGEIQ